MGHVRLRQTFEIAGTAALVSMVLAAAISVSSGRPGGEVRPLSRLVRDRPDVGVLPEELTVVTPNIWKANHVVLAAVAHLVAQRPDVIGPNEARGLRSELRTVPGHRKVLPAGGCAGTANPILLRRRRRGFSARVRSSCARPWVAFELAELKTEVGHIWPEVSGGC